MKRKSNHADGQEVLRKHPAARCILHVSGIQHGDFTSLSNVKGPATKILSQLHNIRHRRLIEPPDLPNSMEDVCNQIPETLAGENLEAIGYHRGCYQKFTKNQDRLKCNITTDDRASTTRSPGLPRGCFPVAETCIFCEKLELKSCGKTERCIKFPVLNVILIVFFSAFTGHLPCCNEGRVEVVKANPSLYHCTTPISQ